MSGRHAYCVRLAKNDLWTDQELALSVLAYRMIQALEASSASFTKAEIRRFVLDECGLQRSKASFELRMGNISSVLKDRGDEWIEGYVPREHVGQRISNRIGRLLDEFSFQLESDSAIEGVLDA